MQIPEELEARLVNWGRTIRDEKPTYKSWLAKHQTPDPENVNPRDTSIVPVNVRDAEEVNSVWRSMPSEHYDERRAKFLVAAMYSSTSSQLSTLIRLRKDYRIRIRPSEIDRLMGIAVKYIGKKLGYVIY